MLTSSSFVEMRVFSFWLVDAVYAMLIPSDTASPFWLFMSAWTWNAVSTQHLMTLVLSAFIVSPGVLVSRKYCTTLRSSLQSASLPLLTGMHRNSTVSSKSGLARLHKNMELVAMRWNLVVRASSSSRGGCSQSWTVVFTLGCLLFFGVLRVLR